jgi:outer membrane protein OmpA-like peptidoglycan-associated protein
MKKTTLFLFLICLTLFSEGSNAQTIFSFYFESNSASLGDSVQTKIQKMAEFIVKQKVDSIHIYGYTDHVGSVASNLALAKARIQSVQQRLPKSNLGKLQLFAQGENYRISSYKFASSNLALWRRVDVKLFVNQAQSKDAKTNEVTQVFRNETETLSQFSALKLDSLPLEPIRLKIQFVGGTAQLLPISVQEMRDLYTFLVDNPSVKAFIRGHVCCEHDYNLSVERAEMVYQTLVKAGIDSDRLERQGFSNSKPLVNPERTEYDRQQNRRVDVIFSL